MKRTVMIAAGAVALAVAGVVSAGVTLPSSTTSASAQIVAAEQRATFAIRNMTCATCPITVRKAMENVAGVKSVTVNFESKTATAVYDPSVATVDAIAAASTNAGYPARATRS